MAPRDGRVQTLVGGKGPAPPVDGPLRLFAPRNAGSGPKARNAAGGGAVAAGGGGKVVEGNEEKGSGGPLWKRGDVVQSRDWRRGGRWQRAVLVGVHGAAFGDAGARVAAAGKAAAGKAAAGKAAAGNKPASQKAAAGSQAGAAGAAVSYEIQAPGPLNESVGWFQTDFF